MTLSYPIRLHDRLCLGPDDAVRILGRAAPVGRARAEADDVIAVALHRTHGAWTHVYRIAVEPDGRSLVHLERVLAGDRVEAAAAWASERYAFVDVYTHKAA
ncbi:hypothetical protein [Marinivivus vitaminiproducens]|uniref:hypothetical protein n=1 Tax=Marinivivus vitaminiproducens TaxID=3035935 RepID=UPI0027A1F9CD|nr:hypothetical protein P4R82_22800 [Geminicoccaceae bacterium SCSIO 64248]